MNTNIKQHDKSDCAVACMASVARFYGREIPMTILREASGTDMAGTSVKGMIDACAQVGFIAKGYRSPERDIAPLLKLDVPAILHVINDEDELHFVVLYGFRRGKAVIMDPKTGTRKKINIETLHKGWSGYLVVMTPGLEENNNNLHISSLFIVTRLYSCYPNATFSCRCSEPRHTSWQASAPPFFCSTS
jgi:ABC-type bacteriocin/lantibiotic exporters, contain an N-terminal double-glycine peptidase domain